MSTQKQDDYPAKPPWQQLEQQQQLQQAPSQDFPDLTIYRESELPPDEDEEEETPVEHPPRNAVVEGDDIDLAEEQEEEAEDDDTIEDTIEFPNAIGDEQTQAVSIRGPKEAVERVKTERMLHADYSRKTTELARQRAGIADAVRQAQDEGRKQYVQQLEALKTTVWSTLEPETRNVDWEKLAIDDPPEFMRLMARGHQLKTRLQEIESEQRRTAEIQAREDEKRAQEKKMESLSILTQTIPGWNDMYYSQILTTVAQKYGFSLDEVAPIIDPRIIRMMSDITKYHQGSDKRAIVKKKIANTPKAIPAGHTPEPRGEVDRGLKARFLRTRSIDDGARLLEQRLKRR